MKESVPREFRTINNRFLKSITKQAWNLDATELRTETTVFIFKTIRLLGRRELFKKRAENSLKQIRHAHTSFISENTTTR